MTEICDKCKTEMSESKSYNSDGFDIWEYTCLNCYRTKIIHACENCEHCESWYEN